MDILSLLGCFCILLFWFFPLSYFFLRRFFCERFFPWVHWPCIINKFWCHWLSSRLAHPNTLFAIYLVPIIRAVVYGILLHTYIAVLYWHQSFILCQRPHVAWPKPMACQLLSACCTSNERQTILHIHVCSYNIDIWRVGEHHWLGWWELHNCCYLEILCILLYCIHEYV